MKDLFKNKQFPQDIFFSSALAVISIILIGYYLNYEYLLTGYQDWIYHAFRIKSISEFGITSWDHRWANGINYWQSYQYIPHLLALGVSKILSVSPATSIMIWTVTIFLYLRVAGYVVLRKIGTPPIYSFLAMAFTFLIPQEWGAMQDVSIYFSLILVPVFMAVWIKATQNKNLYFLAATLAGFTWSVHPVTGLIFTSLLFFDLFFNKSTRLLQKLAYSLAFLVASSSFYVEYLLIPYKFTIPFFSSLEFINVILLNKYFGLGLIFFLMIILSWTVFLMFSKKFEYWVKVVLAYVSSMLIFFWLAKNGYTPAFLNMLQFQRGHIVIATIAPYLFATTFQLLVPDLRSRFKKILVISGVAILIVSAIGMSGSKSASASNSYPSVPVSYFSNREVYGSVFYGNESEFSYFDNSRTRLVGSYNEHLLPGPMSHLFKRLLRPNIGYLDITNDQIELIEDYMQVLGVEYLILPYNSPIVEQANAGDTTFFENKGEIITQDSVYSVIQNTRKINYAYIVDYQDYKDEVGDSSLEDPTLNVRSTQPWNKYVAVYSKFLQDEKTIPLDLEFVYPNSLVVRIPDELPEMSEPVILINQSYDKNWNTDIDVLIAPTVLRFMKIDASDIHPSQVLTLTNTWPRWHWPVEAIAPISVISAAIGVGIYSLKNKK